MWHTFPYCLDGWNMKANITVALIPNFISMSYSLTSSPFRRFRSVPNSYRPTCVH
ncbi:hypothetical protein M408DRAFT_124072 [Serendipita vermifera MAFF 305830]|uniref:Uncharacterized protein n=1 Tax=Serendipita vermifera MAFF 305830 TaxID=933852 RepID=A0A0C2W2Q2_SERVB|nr:hypothetical protein M408DRAFT_124072 [Serendipita vermifera MAFF 305830]